MIGNEQCMRKWYDKARMMFHYKHRCNQIIKFAQEAQKYNLPSSRSITTKIH